MRALIDTHTLIWMAADEVKLGAMALGVSRDPANQLLVSIASLWELAIKTGLGKLNLSLSFAEFVTQVFDRFAIELLPITTDHLVTLTQLPYHHRDPFDRLLAAQCRSDVLPIVSIDSAFDVYGVQRIW